MYSVQFVRSSSRMDGVQARFNSAYNDKKELVCYLRMTEQATWNQEKKYGTFTENSKNPEKYAAVSLNAIELGYILSIISGNVVDTEANFFHDTNKSISNSSSKNSAQIKFTRYEGVEKAGERELKVTKFGIKLVRNGKEYKIGLSAGEAMQLVIFIEATLFKMVEQPEREGQQGNSQQNSLQPATSVDSKPSSESASYDEELPF